MSTSPQCRILVRTAVDWDNMTPARFRDQKDPLSPQLFLHGAIEHDLPTLFEHTFGVNFFCYRGELQKIAMDSLRAVENASITIGFDDFDTWYHDDHDEFIFPIDDDDLFAPNLAQSMEDLDDNTVLVVWDHVMAGFVDFTPEVAIKKWDIPILFSNNWGVRKSFLRSHFSPEQARLFLARHRHAQEETVRIFGIPCDHMPEGKFKKFVPLVHPSIALSQTCYGVDYMHPGSLHFFSMLINSGNPAEAIQSYDLTAALPRHDDIQWATPYLERFSTAIPRLRQTR